MMLNNIISMQQEVESQNGLEGDAYLKTKLGFNILDIFKLGEAEAGGSVKGSGSKKVLETFEIKTTKSVILDEVVKNCRTVDDFESFNEGELIKVDNVRLSLENEDELRIVKFINSGALKDIMAPGTNGIDINGLFNSMFKDYAYKIRGEISERSEELLIKIPLTFENEFESSYSVDDLFVGKVSIVGLYKGKIKIDELRNSFQYFQELGEFQNFVQQTNQDSEDEIQESHYTIKDRKDFTFSFKSSGDDSHYHYIDLLAIIQNVSVNKR
ncbi:hypothetical protein [Sphingobacterium corticibacterium]|uniref:Uncharacterized protein n=1 Tax=Sphingobacterium corticibacterium TaxID=2484746 RepID=A0A4Q6XQK5_9SPHI|nr:hypothetical protein [Sphingobacterium corticibacterium]RZF62540.1 hypothetical protein EWE74_07000 [Sphingobacterium corticibacterium]